MQSFWDDYQIERLRALKAQGLSCREIAARLGVSRNAVIGKIHRLGLWETKAPRLAEKEKEDRRQQRLRIDAMAKRCKREKKIYIAGGVVMPVFETGKVALASRTADVEPFNLTLLELKTGDCRYPYGSGPFTFCGHSALAGEAYCQKHHIFCWVKPIKRRIQVAA